MKFNRAWLKRTALDCRIDRFIKADFDFILFCMNSMDIKYPFNHLFGILIQVITCLWNPPVLPGTVIKPDYSLRSTRRIYARCASTSGTTCLDPTTKDVSACIIVVLLCNIYISFFPQTNLLVMPDYFTIFIMTGQMEKKTHYFPFSITSGVPVGQVVMTITRAAYPSLYKVWQAQWGVYV